MPWKVRERNGLPTSIVFARFMGQISTEDDEEESNAQRIVEISSNLSKEKTFKNVFRNEIEGCSDSIPPKAKNRHSTSSQNT